MNKNSNSTYTSTGAVEYTAKAKPSQLSGYIRKRLHKSLVEHSHPIFLSELDEFDELMADYPNLSIESRFLHYASISEYRKPDPYIMYERTYYPIGWKDVAKCNAQYGRHKEHPVPRRKTTHHNPRKKRKIYTDIVYYSDTARAQCPGLAYGLGDVEEPADAVIRHETYADRKKSKKDKSA